MNVSIIGLGYIGLPTAALIASNGIKVYGVDINQGVVEKITRGEVHIVERDLDGLVQKAVTNGFLTAGAVPQKADVFIIAVPTPVTEGNRPDVTFVDKAVESVIPFLEKENLLIIESTCPVGITDRLAGRIFYRRPDLAGSLFIAYCPERVLPGRILYELEHNDRIVGGINEISAKKAAEFYAGFVKGSVFQTDAKTAEMCKLVENAYRDINIAFANELSILCDKAGVDVWELVSLANRHPRVNILNPGCGVGGHCIAVDPWFLVSQFPEEVRIIKTAREINDFKPSWVVEKIEAMAGDFREKRGRPPVLGCLGLSYKPDTDDTRESAALKIARQLIDRGYRVLANEPNINSDFVAGIKNHTLSSVLRESDLIIVNVLHSAYSGVVNKAAENVICFAG
ncbi:UDP-N-acetyl-D-mannosamine dehydrogenase [Pelotomaculum sp. PtaB.Bin117]|uniref:UDP-N-acetyl-D-mannosamine dehydrogenase n=1 Tax=Pelotomaculum sp. PtaB.Bin117 TaxID=1811694 RepID=UPI0009C4A114|nr:UDP-N-acetyl-D-mannosamine dehydrogenase [Pelotomaculum sp. PtaB.Bin117]OPX92328.1 MAG: UDP-N-acetyl-D-glucosamine 6-dehydrogenase [Pelotomaculum sp. PtaB.Bin117]